MEEFEMNNSPKKLQQSLEDLEKKLKTMQCNCSNTNLQFCEQCFDVLLEDSDRLENLKKSFFDLTGRIYKVKGVFGNGVLNKYNFGRMIGRIALISSPNQSLFNKASLEIILDTFPLRVLISPL